MAGRHAAGPAQPHAQPHL